MNMHQATLLNSTELVQKLEPSVTPLRGEAKEVTSKSTDSQRQVDSCLRRIRKLRSGGQMGAHPLDGLYTQGGPRHFQHVSHADPHEPKEYEVETALVDMLRKVFPRPKKESAENFQAAMRDIGANPEVKELAASAGGELALQVVQCCERLDSWDYDTFKVEKLSNGNALFTTGVALFLKHDLVSHFKIDMEVLCNFWGGTQSGYHPNPYHNSNHAADVLQITHFIISPGGMADVLRLSKEDLLAAIIAAGIHDYDHPGFNNNFHTRTGGYLSTLYNDRSILENHHCACIFEMTRHPRYDIFASLNDDQRKEVRDTLVEMLLSTDMGNHAKIFSQFRRRLAEGPDWQTRKDDVRLALVMAIKMADISNCGRPLELYKKWAEAIASEFYVQGEAERGLKMMVSPFMDRRKHTTDFPKGQISFINYIVAPLFEAMSEFLPLLGFTVGHCQENKEFWQSEAGEAALRR